MSRWLAAHRTPRAAAASWSLTSARTRRTAGPPTGPDPAPRALARDVGTRPAARRLPVAGALVVSAAAVVALTVAVARHPAPFGVDSDLLRGAGRATGLWAVARAATLLGTWPVAGPMLLLVGLLRRAPLRTWAAVVGLCGAGTVGRHVLAAAIHRPRPPMALWQAAAGGPSFPSGHTTTATLAAGALVLLCRIRGHRSAVVAGALVALVVGVTRVLLRVHWATDVVGGWSCGVFCVSAAVLLPRRTDHRGGHVAPGGPTPALAGEPAVLAPTGPPHTTPTAAHARAGGGPPRPGGPAARRGQDG